MAFSLVTRLLAFLFKVFLSRTLGAEAMGLFSMGLAMFGLLTMLPSSGIPLSVSRHVAEAGEDKRAHGYVTAGLLLSLCVNLLTVGIFFAFKPQLLSLFADQRAEKVILIMLPATLSTCIYNVLRAYFMGKRHYVAYSVTETVEEIVNIAVVLVLLYGGFRFLGGGETLAVAFLVGDVFCFVLIAVMYLCLHGRLARPYGTKALLRSSTPITLMRLFTALASTFTAIILPNRLVVSGLGVAASTALYGEAVGMAYPLLFAPLALTSSLSVVLLPELARLASQGKKAEIAQKIDLAAHFILLITTLFFLLFATLGDSLGKLIFNSPNAGAFVTFGAGMVVPLCLAQLTNTAMNSLAMELRCFLYSMLGLALMALCLWFLPAVLGIYALAVAHTVFFGVSTLLNTVTLARRGYTRIRYARSYALVALGTLPIFAIVRLCMRYLLSNASLWVTLLFVGALDALLYALLLLLTRAVDYKAILTIVRRKLTKKARTGA